MVKNRLRVLLAEKKKKMSDLEKETGLSRSAIRGLYYETSKGVSFKTLDALCEYLNCDVGDILVYNPQKEEAI